MTPKQIVEARRICAIDWWRLTGDHTHNALSLLRAALPLLEAAAHEGARIALDQDPDNLSELEHLCVRLAHGDVAVTAP